MSPELVGGLIDTHVHLWDLRRKEVRYPWLEPGVVHPILGDIDAIKSPLYDAGALIGETRFTAIRKIVHVEAGARGGDVLTEPRWVRRTAAEWELPAVMVVHLDLSSADAGTQLEVIDREVDIVGVRDFGIVDYLREPDRVPQFRSRLAHMAEAGLLVDLDCTWEGMRLVRRMASEHPTLRIVLEHVGYPRSRDDEYYAQWAGGIRHLAGADNVFCKVSGLGMTDRSWTVGSLRRWVMTVIEEFGPARCMFGSNWPVDRLSSSYDALVAAFNELIAGCSIDEQQAMCSGNAEAVYFLDRLGSLR